MAEPKIEDLIKPEQQPVSAAEMQVALSGSALSVNRFFILTSPTGVRISFAEQYADQAPVFRTAVNLSVPDAYSLAIILKQVLDNAVKFEVLVPGAQPPAPAAPDGGNAK